MYVPTGKDQYGNPKYHSSKGSCRGGIFTVFLMIAIIVIFTMRCIDVYEGRFDNIQTEIESIEYNKNNITFQALSFMPFIIMEPLSNASADVYS